MPCYHPIHAWHSAKGVFFRDTIDSKKILLPCGRCIGCRLERSRQWAIRLTHENRFHDDSAFITLTYDKDHYPASGSLDVKHFQDFMKRLRKILEPKKIRFFHAGEYGEKKGRPHYHAIIFGEDFRKNRFDLETSDRGDETWSSPTLNTVWPFGLSRVGAVSFESCAYVARYITKKITGPSAQQHYERVSKIDGEIFSLKPEYCTMSKKPGIGYLHLQKYMKEIYYRDAIISRGVPAKPPKYYDKLLEKADPILYQDLKDRRECALSSAPKHDKTERRLADRETVKLAQIGSLKRKYEIG